MQNIKQLKQVYLLSTSNIKYVMDEHKDNKHARYKHKWVEREMSNRKYGRIILRFEPWLIADTAYLLSHSHIYYIISSVYNLICCLIYMQVFTKGEGREMSPKAHQNSNLI